MLQGSKRPHSPRAVLPMSSASTGEGRGGLWKEVRAAGAAMATTLRSALGLYTVTASEVHAEPPHYPWPHANPLGTFDHAAIRRGYLVYREVCAACHSMDMIAFRMLVDVAHTRAEMVEIAAAVDVEDGPDANGEMYQRPGRLPDIFPSPYPNDQAARAANNGALPPDLSLIINGRERSEDYVFSLLIGYAEPPAGVALREGLHYNPYFPGGSIAMARSLYDGMLDYDDGTPGTASQYARDVTTFLTWASLPEHDDRKRLGLKTLILVGVMIVVSGYHMTLRWAPLKTRKIRFV